VKLFIDASVMVAILRREDGYQRWLDPIGAATSRHASPLGLCEAASRMHTISTQRAEQLTADANLKAVLTLAEELAIDIAADDPSDWKSAFESFARYGRTSGHPAALNMGDCFHYAVCRRIGARMLCTSPGEFRLTDLPCVA